MKAIEIMKKAMGAIEAEFFNVFPRWRAASPVRFRAGDLPGQAPGVTSLYLPSGS